MIMDFNLLTKLKKIFFLAFYLFFLCISTYICGKYFFYVRQFKIEVPLTLSIVDNGTMSYNGMYNDKEISVTLQVPKYDSIKQNIVIYMQDNGIDYITNKNIREIILIYGFLIIMATMVFLPHIRNKESGIDEDE